MCRWVVLAETVVGELEADSRERAERAAALAYGQTAAVTRVQSASSYLVGAEETRAAQQRRRRAEDED